MFDAFTGRSKGFAFVEMPEESHAEHAIKILNRSRLDSQYLVVNEAGFRE